MALSTTTRLGLPKYVAGDLSWGTAFSTQQDTADARFFKSGAGSPSAVTADYIGQRYFDTTNEIWYTATDTAGPSTWVTESPKGGIELTLDNNKALLGKDTGGAAENLIKMDGSDQVLVGDLGHETVIQCDDKNGLKTDYGSGDQEILHEGNYAEKDLSPHTMFESAGGTPITQDTLFTIAHGLGEFPKLIEVFVKCNDAGGDLGYADNEEIPISNVVGASSNDRGVTVSRDGTNVYVVVGSDLRVHNKGTFNAANLTYTKWDLHVRAWKN